MGEVKIERSQDRGGKVGIGLHEPNRRVKGLKGKNISWYKKKYFLADDKSERSTETREKSSNANLEKLISNQPRKMSEQNIQETSTQQESDLSNGECVELVKSR